MGNMIRKLKPNSLIVISEVTRLGRNYKMVERILKTIDKKKSYIVSISENLVYGITNRKNKEFIYKVIDSERESDAISRRVKNAQQYIKKNGGYIGKAPFGYKIIKNSRNIPVLKENAEDFNRIDCIVNLSNDCYNYDEIANIMNTKNLFYKNKLWNASKIKGILNKFYPEHMFLNVFENVESKINVMDHDMTDSTNDNILINNKENTNETIQQQSAKNIILDKFTVTITTDENKKRVVSFNADNTTKSKKRKTFDVVDTLSSFTNETEYIKLRSGKIIVKF